MTAARIPYVAARERQLPYALSMIHMRFLTPAPALILNGIIATCMVIPNDVSTLVDYFRWGFSFFLCDEQMFQLLHVDLSHGDMCCRFRPAPRHAR